MKTAKSIPSSDSSQAKRCRKCGAVKVLDEFYANKASHDGHMNDCKSCNREQGKRYRLENPEKGAARWERWSFANIDKISERMKLYRKAHREQIRASIKAHHEQIRAYQQRNLEYYKFKHRANYAVQVALKSGILVRQSCEVCGLTPKRVNGQNRIHAHHFLGYETGNHLKVRWLCVKHHKQAEGSP